MIAFRGYFFVMNDAHEKSKLNQFFATAICGNDILSSSLYVSGIAIAFAGVFAPLVLLFVGLILFFYKYVYTEVVEALPVNGGAYNCLLNATSKSFAAGAGVMTILSYVATAVLSAKVGIEYLNQIVQVPLIFGTIGLLLVFAILVIAGIKDSAKVALGIFALHIVTLTLFVGLGIYHFFSGPSFFMSNLAHTKDIIFQSKGIFMTLYLAFSASLLGISGFESSANFIEEQRRGVFRKTLRNMLIGVAIFNPLIAFVVLNSMSYDAIKSATDFLLADAAGVIAGDIFKYVVVVDAFLVLSGAVLTSFVGVGGLMFRMASDACLPDFLTKVNKKGSYPRIVIGFFLLCSSIMIVTKGNLLSLAGVYTIAFLGVMSSFALGNILLRETRTELKRTMSAPLIFVVLALLGTFFGMIGNIRIDDRNLQFFEIYFIPAILGVALVIYQDYFLRGVMRFTSRIPWLYIFIQKKFHNLIDGNFVVFVRNTGRLHQILEYINRNETGRNITLVVCREGTYKESKARYKEILELIPHLRKAGVFPHLNLSVVYHDEEFGPKAIDNAVKEFRIARNRIMIGSIHHNHAFDYAELGGVRIIL